MNGSVSRRFVLGGLGSMAASGAAGAGAPLTSLYPRLRPSGQRAVPAGPEGLIARAGLSGDVAFAVADARTGKRLEGFHDRTGMPPASVAKTLTTLYALDALGADHRYATQLLRVGPVRNGVLKGDLILAGGGDPTLDTTVLAGMAAELKKAGIREVRGKFRVYDGMLPYVRSIDPGQPDHVGYSPAVSGIALNHNRVHFEWKRTANGYGVTMDGRTAAYRPEVAMARMKVVKRGMPVYTYAQRNGVENWTVASGALGRGGSRWLPVRLPGEYASDIFRTLARAQGIVLTPGGTLQHLPQDTAVLTQNHSPPLSVILKGMLKYSNNLTAEMVGMSATLARGTRPASLKASAGEMNRWAARTYGMSGTRLVDHSGLEDASRMTPDDLVRALVQARQRGILRPLLKPIKMRDAKGRPMKSQPIKIDAKTGTLNFVSCLAGYMTAPDGAELAFAIFTADKRIRAKIGKADREVPPGARTWNRKAKKLQQRLIERWGMLYGS